MSRPKKPINELTIIRDNRGYEPTVETLKIQQEILSQYEKIKKSISKLDVIKDIEVYKVLITLLLRIENQVKTFSKKTDKLKFNNLIKELEE